MQAALPSPARVGQALEKTYARSELAPPKPGALDPVRRFFARILEAIGEWLDRIPALHSASPVLFWLIVGTLGLAAAFLVALLLKRLFERLGESGPAAARARAEGARERPRDAGGWEDEARRLAGAGRYREAAVALYQALVLRMDAAGAVRFDPSKTPGDYRREARPHPLSRALGAFLRVFEPAVFGGRPLDAAAYERLRAAAGEGGARG